MNTSNWAHARKKNQWKKYLCAKKINTKFPIQTLGSGVGFLENSLGQLRQENDGVGVVGLRTAAGESSVVLGQELKLKPRAFLTFIHLLPSISTVAQEWHSHSKSETEMHARIKGMGEMSDILCYKTDLHERRGLFRFCCCWMRVYLRYLGGFLWTR